jgi:hypothetical protein
MIRINLLKSTPGGVSRASQRVAGRKEAVLGAALLAAACLVLFFLARQSEKAGTSEPSQAAVALAEQPVRVPAPEAAEAPAEPAGAAVSTEAAGPPANAAFPPAAATETPEAPSCLVTGVAIDAQPEALTVSVRAGAELPYKSFELANPERLAIDMAGCGFAVPMEQFWQSVGQLQVERVRISLFQEQPPIVRLVLDFSQTPRYQIRPVSEGLEVRILGGQR